MSKTKLAYSIHDELKRLNQQIDLKIIRGQSYIREAHQHRILRRKLKEEQRSVWLTRSFRFASFL